MDKIIRPPIFKGYDISAGFSKRINSTDELGLKKLFLPVQKHTDNIIVIKEREMIDEKIVGDAVITDLRDIAVGVKTADCVPILLYDKKRNVVAAVHSGWRGTSKNIVDKTVHRMKSDFKSSSADILAAIGPSICGNCYTVGKDVVDELKNVIDFVPKKINDKFFIDLKDINRKLLIKAGLSKDHIYITSDCTYCKNEEYQSYRYHKNTRSFQISYIRL
ncbi:MAG: peptidoglycan editing factor PgeF [Elusimicrobia bacterium]|nr:peptidoglycan editing factor PgeF [Elusimicrobiota bacterium]